MVLVRPSTQNEGFCTRGAVAAGVPKVVAGQRAADIHLVGGQVGDGGVAVGGEEAVLVAEIVIDARHVGVLRQRRADGGDDSRLRLRRRRPLR